MDEQKKKKIRQEVHEDFKLGRARLFRIEAEEKARAEIAEGWSRLFAAFKQLGPPEKELELTQCLGRLLMNFSKMASYRGVLEGYNVFRTGLELGEDRASYRSSQMGEDLGTLNVQLLS
jgi:hypothetical protein